MNKKTCYFCGNRASPVVVIMLNGKKKVFYFCSECSEAEDFYERFCSFAAEGKKEEESYCPECSYSYKDFKEYGFMGCPRCYEYFAPGIGRYLSKIHRSLSYMGKKPRNPRQGKGSAFKPGD